MRHYWKRGEDLGGAILAGARDGCVLLAGLDADRCPLCSSRPAARLHRCNRLACRTPGFTPTALVQKGTVQSLSPWSSLYFIKSESQSLTCPHPFFLVLLKGPRSLQRAKVPIACSPTPFYCCCGPFPAPGRPLPHLPVSGTKIKTLGSFSGNRRLKNCLPFSLFRARSSAGRGCLGVLGECPPVLLQGQGTSIFRQEILRPL